MFYLTDKPIDSSKFKAKVEHHQAGGYVSFEGWVRNHNQGHQVSSLEYEIYPELARKEGEKVIKEALEKFNIKAATCIHRYGHLKIGEVSIYIGASATHRDDAFKACRYIIDEVKERLPIWKKEHYVNKETKWVFCRDHSHHVHFHESDYYQKQSKLVDQSKLKAAKVAVIGAGGLSSPLLLALSSAGIGHLHIIDHDKIEISNIHRQPLFTPGEIGDSKAEVAKSKCSSLNPYIKISSSRVYLDSSNIEDLLYEFDYIVDCSDNLSTKFLLHDYCFQTRKFFIGASIHKYEGQIRSFDPNQNYGCLRCLTDSLPQDEYIGNCNDYGVLGASVQSLGSLQAHELIHFIQNGKNNSLSHTLWFDFKALEQSKIKNFRKENCTSCRGELSLISQPYEININELKNIDHELIDIRDKEDIFLNDFLDLDKKVIVYCHKGNRSKKVVKELWRKGHKNFYSLRGGACSL